MEIIWIFDIMPSLRANVAFLVNPMAAWLLDTHEPSVSILCFDIGGMVERHSYKFMNSLIVILVVLAFYQ